MSKKGQRSLGQKIFMLAIGFLLTIGMTAWTADGAEKYPSRPINLIVPYAPGGAADLGSKIVADKMAEFLGPETPAPDQIRQTPCPPFRPTFPL